MLFSFDLTQKFSYSLQEQYRRIEFPAMLGSMGIGIANSPLYGNNVARRGPDRGVIFQYTLEGLGELVHQDKTYKLIPGQAFLIDYPGPFHYYQPNAAAVWKFAYLSMHGPAIQQVYRIIFKEHGPILSIPIESRPVQMMAEIINNFKSFRPYLNHDLSLFSYDFMLSLHRCLNSSDEFADLDLPGPIRSAVHYIERFYSSNDLTVDQIATAVHLSKYHFSRMFKKYTGCSPGEYLLDFRLRQAYALLCKGHRIKEVVNPCGFSDVGYFCRAFKKRFRHTPRGAQNKKLSY